MEGTKKRNILVVVAITLSVAVIVAAAAILIPVLSEGKNGGSGKDKNNRDDIFQGYTPYFINSDSMAPTLENGDVVLTAKVKDANDLKIGDVIVFQTIMTNDDGSLYRGNDTKRIIDIEYNPDGTVYYFKAKGDAMKTEDAVPVTPDTIVAKQINSGIDENGKTKDGLKIEDFEEKYGDFEKYEQ